jgi:hypothetical protein
MCAGLPKKSSIRDINNGAGQVKKNKDNHDPLRIVAKLSSILFYISSLLPSHRASDVPIEQ